MPAREQEGRFYPEQAVYRVSLDIVQPEAASAGAGFRQTVRRGTVTLRGASDSLLARAARHAVSLLWREAGL